MSPGIITILDPRLPHKREIMQWWTSWFETQCAAAIEADLLLDIAAHPDRLEDLRQAVYVQRYGEEAWQAKISKSCRTGHKR